MERDTGFLLTLCREQGAGVIFVAPSGLHSDRYRVKQMKSGCGHVPAATNWDVVTLRDLDGIESIRSIWQQMHNSEPFPTLNADIDRYIAYLKTTSDDAQPYVMLVRHNDCPVAMVIGRVETSRLRLRVGYATFSCPRSKYLRVVYGGILGRPDADLCSWLVSELARRLRRREFDIVYFSYLRTDTPFYRSVRNMPGFLTRDRFPKIDEHWRMSIPEKIDQFYAARSRGHRHNIRSAIRKFERDYPGNGKVVNYTSESDVDDFLRIAEDISSRTYQSALGVGIVNDERTKCRTMAAAECGWFRGHILLAGGKSCAFQLGMRYQNVYYMVNIGYDPALSCYKPGLILFLRVLESLCDDPSVDMIDFYFGGAEYKHRYGTEHWFEARIHIFALRPCPVFINALRSFVEAVNAGLEYVVRKIDSAHWIKRKWRHLLQRKHPTGEHPASRPSQQARSG